jgi:hypothetical protein
MSERDELALVIHTAHCLYRAHSEYCAFWREHHTSADAVLAAGYRKEARA